MTDETQSDFPEAWRPDPGQKLIGTLEHVEVIDPNGSGPYPCLTIKSEDGLKNVHAFHQVLRKEIARRRPKIGDELAITYHGKKEGGAFNGYHSYAVSGGQAQEVNWDAWLPEEEQAFRQTSEPPITSSSPSESPAPEPVDDDDDSDLPF